MSEIKEILQSIPWKQGHYAKQSWKNWLHSIAPYVGRITPAFAHWLIRLFSTEGDTILDPFCGIGTIPLEADLLKRIPIGIDLNPYAYVISKAKFDRKPLDERIKWIKDTKLDIRNVDIHSIDSYALQFYHSQTLKEIIAIRDNMLRENQYFLLGCLLGISHGHRPQHLSAITGYIIPYPKKNMIPQYKNVKEKLIQKVTRMYKDGFKLKTKGRILKGDIRTIDLPQNSVDAIITSPPYYETLDYVSSNKLRLILLNYRLEEQKDLATNLIQDKENYLDNMRIIGLRLKKVLKKESLCIYILGDVIRGKKRINTAQNISKIYKEIGYETLFCIEDKIPKEKSTIGKFAGEEELKEKSEKSDRILVMKPFS